MKINYLNKRAIKLISIILITFIVISTIVLVYSVFDNKKTNELGEITSQEINNVSSIFYANTLKETTNSKISNLASVESAHDLPMVERYFTLYDFDESKKYIYVEYYSGGFAIYDRQGEFIYEKSEIGKGPFDNYDGSENLYYGGPSYYFVSIEQGYQHIVTNNKIDKNEAYYLSEELDKVRQDYIGEQLSELSLRSVERTVYETYFLLGENLSEESQAKKDFKTNVKMYFTMKAVAEQYGSVDKANTLQIWDMNVSSTPYQYPFIDLFSGNNQYGSCGYVSLSTVMLFYDRLGIAKMINNQANWHLMYDYYFQTTHPEIGAYLQNKGSYYSGKLSDIPNTYLTSEFLHQELIYLHYPELRGASSYNSDSFGSNADDRKKAYIEYCTANSVLEYDYITDSGTFKLPEKIVNGNPCIVSLTNAPFIGNSSHSVVAYGFYGTKPLWYTVSSITCDYGWDRDDSSDPIYAAISVNASFVNRNECLKVYKY